METAMTPAMNSHHQPLQVKSLPTQGSEVSRGHVPQIRRSRGQDHFIKRSVPRQMGGKSRAHASAAATEKRAAGRERVTRPLPI
jgi:hypothetical protein